MGGDAVTSPAGTHTKNQDKEGSLIGYRSYHLLEAAVFTAGLWIRKRPCFPYVYTARPPIAWPLAKMPLLIIGAAALHRLRCGPHTVEEYLPP